MIALGWLDADGEPSALAKHALQERPRRAASTTLWAATSAKLELASPGSTAKTADIAAPTEPESPTRRFAGVDAHACSDEGAEKLWAMSEAMLAEA
jgi:hypothetical protein